MKALRWEKRRTGETVQRQGGCEAGAVPDRGGRRYRRGELTAGPEVLQRYCSEVTMREERV